MANQSSQGTRIEMWDGIAPVTHAITGVTKATPAVVSVAVATGLTVGDIVVPKNTGFKSIDEFPFRISAVSTLAITLEDSDTSAEPGAAIAGSLDEYQLVEVCMAGFSTNQPAGSQIDVTTMCDVARRTLTGLPGQGTFSANGFWDAADTVQAIARAAYRSALQQVFRVRFKDNSGAMFRGALNQLNFAAAVDAGVTITMGGTINGRVQYLPAS